MYEEKAMGSVSAFTAGNCHCKPLMTNAAMFVQQFFAEIRICERLPQKSLNLDLQRFCVLFKW